MRVRARVPLPSIERATFRLFSLHALPSVQRMLSLSKPRFSSLLPNAVGLLPVSGCGDARVAPSPPLAPPLYVCGEIHLHLSAKKCRSRSLGPQLWPCEEPCKALL